MRAFVLVDGRHGLKDSDHATMRLLDSAAVSYAVVLTKRDEVKAADQGARIEATLEALRKHLAAYPGAFFTSARTGEGSCVSCAPTSRVSSLSERAARPWAKRDPPLGPEILITRVSENCKPAAGEKRRARPPRVPEAVPSPRNARPST